MSINELFITPNGPAVEGVNVTRRSHPATCPGSLAGICPGGEEGMAQFLQVPAKDKIVSAKRICPEPESRIK
jgi:hypothetical protein